VGLWIVALLAITVASRGFGSKYSENFTLPSTDSSKALDLLKTISKDGTAGETDTIVWHVDNGTVRDAAIQTRMSAMLAKVSTISEVESVTSPYSTQGTYQVSKDGKTAYASVSFTQDSAHIKATDVKKVISTAQDARMSGLQVELGGNSIKQAQQAPASSSEAIGVLAAAVVLFIAFGSLLAMTVPLIAALVALGAGIGGIELLSHVMNISSIAPTLGALIGLGVGIDYALFIITRYTSGIMGGLKPEAAAVKALDTAGRAVIFAGGTVCVALLGLLTVRISFLGGMGIAAAVVVLISVFASITLLPALLGIFKMRILSRRNRRKLRQNGPVNEETVRGFWARNATFVERRAVPVAIVATLAIAILIVPFFSLRLGSSDSGNDPKNSTTRKAYDMLADGFGPGFNGPLQLVAKVETTAQKEAFARLSLNLLSTSGIAQSIAVPVQPGSDVRVIQVTPTTSPESKETSDLIKNLRKNVVPKAVGSTGLKVYVGGATAIFDDFATIITNKLPVFLAVIIGFGFLILLIAFRSIMVPLTAAVMNLLAAGAAFGVVVAVFQWGWGSNIPGIGGAGPIESFLPVIMLSILFGLSMDYQVFLVSRMHEAWVHGKDNHYAVRLGQRETGRVITAAATIMILVFLSFVMGGDRVIAEFGIGLAASVLIDAFILRNFLVPALMHIFGSANWWLPKWLDRILPHLAVEPMDEVISTSAKKPAQK
jgi:RND superfamily putative drug exporter